MGRRRGLRGCRLRAARRGGGAVRAGAAGSSARAASPAGAVSLRRVQPPSGPAPGAAARPSPAASSLWCPAGRSGRSGRSRRLLRARLRPDGHAPAVPGARLARRLRPRSPARRLWGPCGLGPRAARGPVRVDGADRVVARKDCHCPRRAGTPRLPTPRGCWGRRSPGAGGVRAFPVRGLELLSRLRRRPGPGGLGRARKPLLARRPGGPRGDAIAEVRAGGA